MPKCTYEELIPYPVLECTYAVWKETDDLQTQIYIIIAVFSGVCALLLIFVFALLLWIMRLRKKMSNLGSTEVLQRQGYETYSGKPTSVQIPRAPTSPQTNGGVRFSRKGRSSNFY